MTQTVQTNGVQPLSKTWELSLYELQRTPQVIINTHHRQPVARLVVSVLTSVCVFASATGGHHRWPGDSSVPQVPAQ